MHLQKNGLAYKYCINLIETKSDNKITHGSSPPPPNFRGGDLKISDQNNWVGHEQKIKFGGGGGGQI